MKFAVFFGYLMAWMAGSIHCFQSPLSPSRLFSQRGRRIQPFISLVGGLSVHVSNETDVWVPPPEEPQNQRIKVDFKDTARKATDNADDDEEFQQRVKNSKFMERNKHWVVLVDDEESIRLAVGDYLYDQGYQITACADADAFLDVCHNTPDNNDGSSLPQLPDAIISDIRMPGKDGLELLNLIRADERLSRVPVILLTAKGMTTDRIAGYKAGANAYLSKPFDPDELLSILDNTIQRRKQMTSNNEKGGLVDLKQEIAGIKDIMKRNGEKVVQKTNVYLTLVEREVLDLLCRGYTNKEIAEERGVNIIGVNRTITKLYTITQTETRTELVRWAFKTGYASPRGSRP